MKRYALAGGNLPRYLRILFNRNLILLERETEGRACSGLAVLLLSDLMSTIFRPDIDTHQLAKSLHRTDGDRERRHEDRLHAAKVSRRRLADCCCFMERDAGCNGCWGGEGEGCVENIMTQNEAGFAYCIRVMMFLLSTFENSLVQPTPRDSGWASLVRNRGWIERMYPRGHAQPQDLPHCERLHGRAFAGPLMGCYGTNAR